MNKFSDGFSDKDYEDLLNEYAGETLGSKTTRNTDVKKSEKPVRPARQTAAHDTVPKKKPAPTREKRTDSTAKNASAPVKSEQTFNIDISKKKQYSDFSLDLGTIKAYDESAKDTNNTYPSDTVEFNSSEFAQRQKFYESALSSDNTKSTPKSRNAAKKRFAMPQVNKEKIRSAVHRKRNEEFPADDDIMPFAVKPKKRKINIKQVPQKALQLIVTNKQIVIIFICCIAVSIVLSSIALSCINDVLAINRDDEKTVEVILPNDADTATAVKVLDEAGLIKNRLFCNVFLKIMEITDQTSSKKAYLPGVYYFTESMGVEKMIRQFKTSSKRGALISVTIPEGYTIDQIFERLEKNQICTAESLYKTIDNTDFSSEYDFIKYLDNKEDRYHVLEGYFFPATYEFEQGADPASVIREFLNAFKNRWTDEYAARASELSMNVDDIIRIASIIEKEAYGDQQFKLVSSVIHNRLNRSGLNPTLDCNSTKDYVTNTISKHVTSASKLAPYITKYDTYQCEGLPVGAICNPGDKAIKAALYPETTDYYYFRHDKNGKIYMAKTIEEHNANGIIAKRVNEQKD